MKRCVRCGGPGEFRGPVCPSCMERGLVRLVIHKDRMVIGDYVSCGLPTGHRSRKCQRCSRSTIRYSREGEITRTDDVVALTTARIGFRLMRGFHMVLKGGKSYVMD